MILPSGRYFIGDPYIVLSDDFLLKWKEQFFEREGLIRITGVGAFAMFSTEESSMIIPGDSTDLGVSNGVIGIIPTEMWSDDITEKEVETAGDIFETEEEIQVIIIKGHIVNVTLNRSLYQYDLLNNDRMMEPGIEVTEEFSIEDSIIEKGDIIRIIK